MDAPSARELLGEPELRRALEIAWVDSDSESPEHRHEEGGWIFMNVTTGEIMVRRAARGAESWIDLNDPPSVAGCVVVGKFHTHPNPTHEGWEPGPSGTDLITDAVHGVPDLIRADNGMHFSGPDRRRGGLAGKAGFPL